MIALDASFTRHDESPVTSIIVLIWNGREHVSECFRTIFEQDDSDFEVIAVDNGSTDDSITWIQTHYPTVRIISSPKNRGYCGGMNLGIRHAQGEYIFLLNQDISLDASCLRNLTRTMKNASTNVIGVFPKVVFYSLPHFINAFGVRWYEQCHWRDTRVGLFDAGQFTDTETVFGSIFPAVMFKRSLFEKIGGFDECFWSYCEDFDVCYRAGVMGYTFLAQPSSEIRHKYRASSRDTSDPLWSRYWFVRNYLMVFLKNYEWKNLRLYARIIFLRYYWLSFKNAWHHRTWSEVKMYLKVAVNLMFHLPHILVERRSIQKQRKVSDREIWSTGSIEEFNIYHVDGNIVLSLNALRAAVRNEMYDYQIGERGYSSI